MVVCLLLATAGVVTQTNAVDTTLLKKGEYQKVQAYMHPKAKVNTPPPAAKPKVMRHKVQHKHQVKHQVKKRYKKVRAGHRYRYIRGYGMVDCWGMSDRIYNQLTRSGQRARIIQYATSLSSRHRSVQVYKNGGWTNYDYSGYASTYHATSNSVNGKVVK